MFSVLIPAFNAKRFLAETLASVGRQTVSEWEIVVFEDGSDDGTNAIVESFAGKNPCNRIVYDRSDLNCGVSATRNRLLELSNGEFVAFLDADDKWSRNHLSSFQKRFASGADIVASDVCICDSLLKPVQNYKTSIPGDQSPLIQILQKSFIITSSSVALRMHVAEQVGSFDTDLVIGEDRDYWTRALKLDYQLDFTHEATCMYRKHDSSAMTKTLQVAHDAVIYHQKHFGTLGLPHGFSSRILAESLICYGRLLRRGDPQAAKKLFYEAWLHQRHRIDFLGRYIQAGFW